MCKCGNIEDLMTDKTNENFKFRGCGDGTTALVCKKCTEVVFINIKNSRSSEVSLGALFFILAHFKGKCILYNENTSNKN